MRKISLFLTLAIFLAWIPLTAQTTPPSTSLTFFLGNDESYYAIPLRNTLNGKIFVFYHRTTPSNDLYFRFVDSNGNLGPEKAISVNLGTGVLYDAAWHPKAKRYMVVYMKNGFLYARAVKSSGAYGSPERKLSAFNISTDRMRISPVKRRKFAIFLARDNRLTVFLIKRTAVKSSPEKTLAQITNGKVLLGSGQMQNDQNATLYYMLRSNVPGIAKIRLIQVNHKLKVMGNYAIANVNNPPQYYRFFGNYHPVKKVHAVIFEDKYCIAGEKGNIVKPLSLLPTTYPARTLRYDPATKRFCLLTGRYYEISGTNQGGDFYLSFFYPKGTFAVVESLRKAVTGDSINVNSNNLEFAPNGNYLITWGMDWPSHGGFYGIYFN